MNSNKYNEYELIQDRMKYIVELIRVNRLLGYEKFNIGKELDYLLKMMKKYK